VRTRAVAVDRARGRAAQARQNGRAFRALIGFNRDKYWINSQSLCARSTMVQCNSRPRASVVFFPWAHHRFIIHSRIVLDAFDSFDGHRSFSMHSIRRSSVVLDAFDAFDGHRSFSMHSMHSMVIGRSRCIRCIRRRRSSVVLDAFDSIDGHRSFSMHSIRSMVIGRSRCIRFVRYVEANFPGARPCDRRSTFDALDAFDALARASARR